MIASRNMIRALAVFLAGAVLTGLFNEKALRSDFVEGDTGLCGDAGSSAMSLSNKSRASSAMRSPSV